MNNDVKSDGAREADQLPDLTELPESELEQVAGGGFTGGHHLVTVAIAVLLGIWLP
jgi:hypothetical protein